MLPYPIGDLDTDPEEILTFEGIFPVPRRSRGIKRKRALVTIRFFDLRNREPLWRRRFEVVKSLWRAFEDLASDDETTRYLAQEDIQFSMSAAAEHASCARAYVRLYREDPDAAYQFYLAARDFSRTSS